MGLVGPGPFLRAAFFHEEAGQDLVEYTLLMAGIALACAGMIMAVGSASAGLWSTVNSRLAAANNTGS
jgi:Flp pilus assembly pilin Flp